MPIWTVSFRAKKTAREARYQKRFAEEQAVYEAIRTGGKRYDAR